MPRQRRQCRPDNHTGREHGSTGSAVQRPATDDPETLLAVPAPIRRVKRVGGSFRVEPPGSAHVGTAAPRTSSVHLELHRIACEWQSERASFAAVPQSVSVLRHCPTHYCTSVVVRISAYSMPLEQTSAWTRTCPSRYNRPFPETWPSGRRHSPAKGAYGPKPVSRVRIPASPPVFHA